MHADSILLASCELALVYALLAEKHTDPVFAVPQTLVVFYERRHLHAIGIVTSMHRIRNSGRSLSDVNDPNGYRNARI